MTEEFRRETDSWSIVSDEGFNEIIIIDAFAWRKCDIFRTVFFSTFNGFPFRKQKKENTTLPFQSSDALEEKHVFLLFFLRSKWFKKNYRLFFLYFPFPSNVHSSLTKRKRKHTHTLTTIIRLIDDDWIREEKKTKLFNEFSTPTICLRFSFPLRYCSIVFHLAMKNIWPTFPERNRDSRCVLYSSRIDE